MREFLVRPYCLGDLERLAPQSGDPASVIELMQAASQGAKGWTLVDWDTVTRTGSGPLACAFAREAEAGHWMLAASIRKDMPWKAWGPAARALREQLASLSKYYGCKAITATVRTSHPRAKAFLERFGFVLDEDGFDYMPGYQTLTIRTA